MVIEDTRKIAKGEPLEGELEAGMNEKKPTKTFSPSNARSRYDDSSQGNQSRMGARNNSAISNGRSKPIRAQQSSSSITSILSKRKNTNLDDDG